MYTTVYLSEEQIHANCEGDKDGLYRYPALVKVVRPRSQ